MAYVFDTRHQSLAERQAFWVETMGSNIVPVEIDTGRDPGVHAAMMVAEFGDLGLRRVVGGSHDYRRTKENISASDPETFQIAFPLKGSSVLVQDNREARLSPGQMVLYDTSRPFVLNMQENFEWEVFRLPKLMLRRSNR